MKVRYGRKMDERVGMAYGSGKLLFGICPATDALRGLG